MLFHNTSNIHSGAHVPYRTSLLVTTAALIAAATHVSAQQTPPDDPADLGEIIVTGTPFGLSRRATTIATTVLDEGDLAVAPSAGLGDLLNGTPGLRSSGFAPGASRPVIRGLTGPRVQVLTNGVGLIDASSISPDHQVASDPAESNRIEIIRGPSTLIYGGAAIGGVVNVLDGRIPHEMPQPGLGGRITTQVSSVDRGTSLAGQMEIGIGSVVLHLDGLQRRSGDYAIPVPAVSERLALAEGLARGAGRRLLNSDQQVETYGLGASYIGVWGYAGLSFNDTQSAYGVVAEPTAFILLDQHRVDARGEYRFQAGPLDSVRASFGRADYSHTEFEDVGVPGTVFRSSGWELRTDLIQRRRAGWSGSVGFQGLSRSLSALGLEAYLPSTSIDERGLYTVQRLDRGRFGLEGGLRFDQRALTATTLGTPLRLDLQFNSWSGSGSVSFRPAEGMFLGLSLSRNERAPSEVELFADGLHVATAAYERGDPNLTTEIATTLEATLHYDRGRLHGDLHLYSSDYDGFIDSRDTGATHVVVEGSETLTYPIFAYVQTQATFQGLEAEAGVEVWREGDRTIGLEASADWVRAETDLGPAARIPPWSLTARLRYSSAPVDAHIEVRHLASQNRLAAFERPTDAYTLVNAFAAWRPLGDDGLTVFAEARNLFNREAREHVSFLKDIAPMPGRNLRVGLAYRF